MQRILALDVGDRRIGLAVSDALGFTAQGLETYTRTGDDKRDAAYIVEVANGYAPAMLLFGLPRNMDGSYGFQCDKVRAFADAVLAQWDGPSDFFDERLTTMSAERVLSEGNVRGQKRKQVIDKMAAVVILQGYLERHRE